MNSRYLLAIFFIGLVSVALCSPSDESKRLSKRNSPVNLKLKAFKRIVKRDCMGEYGYCDCGCCGDDTYPCNECGMCCGC
jgi:hypothetical protein